jgi:putative endopeptidase
MTHGFDPDGKQFNKVGKEEEWMVPADSKAFDALTEKMIAHFNKQTFGDYKCNGKLTVGENTADLGGLYIGYDAFMKLLAKKGVTGDELDRQGREFFRAFAYTWMGNLGTEYIQLINNDVHALDPVRVNGNVYLMDEFYRLFNIKSGKRYLAPADRIEIW